MSESNFTTKQRAALVRCYGLLLELAAESDENESEIEEFSDEMGTEGTGEGIRIPLYVLLKEIEANENDE